MNKQFKEAFQWTPKLVDINLIKPTPKNYKIKNDLGKERLQALLKAFGLAGTIVVNTDYTLIDGNSRVEEEKAKGRKKIWVSYPNRKLSVKEFKEMSALFDHARAGDVDTESIEADLGTTKDFYSKYKMAVPMHILNKMGAKALAELEYPEEGKRKGIEARESDSKMVQFFFSSKQEADFRKMEVMLMKRFKVNNTTDLVLKVYKHVMK